MAFGTVSGTFQGNNASIPASFASALSTGSGVVNIGDIVVAMITEQTALTVTSVTDSQGNTYTAQNAGTLSGANVSGRMFWTRITTAGTLTSVTATCTSSTNNGVIVAAIIQGPFLASPVDVNLANAPDLTSPFTAPASGTMAQTTEVVVSWCASTGSAAFTGTAPTIIAIQQASAAVVEGVIGTQVPPSTTTVTPTYTGTAPTANELGTISFKGAIAELDAAYSQPLSEPSVKTRIAPRLAITLMASGLFSPVIRPILPTDTKWLVPLSEPTRRVLAAKKVDLFPFTAASAETVTIDKWLVSFIDPRLKRGLSTASQQALAFVATVATAAAPLQSWLTPLTDPVCRIPAAQKVNLFPFTAVATAETVTVDKWFTSFTDPVWAKRQLAIGSQQSLAFVEAEPFAETVTESRWHQPLSEPVRQKNLPSAQQQVSAFVPVVAQVSIDWLAPLSEPVRVRTSPANQQTLAFAPNPIVAIGWSVSFSEPARIKQRAIADYAYAPLAVSEVVTIDKWFNPLAPPLSAKPGLRVSSQPSYFAPIVTDNSITLNNWFSPLTEPARINPSRTSSQQSLALVEVSPFAETVTESRWHQPWSEPLRSKPGLSVANQAAFFAPSTVISGEIVTVDKWFVALSDPSKPKTSVAVASIPTSTISTNPVVSFGWAEPLSDPSRAKAALAAANQVAFFAPSTVIATEVVTVDKWFQQLSDPTRRKPEDRDRYSGENDWTAVAVSMEWFAPLNEPVRQKIGLSVTQQQALAQSVFVTTETITVDKWFVPFQNPPKPKTSVSTASQPAHFLVATVEVITLDKWFAPLADPVRVKPALLTGRQQFLTWPTQIIIPSLTSWWRPLAEPPKAKAGLLTANQRFATQAADFIPHPNQFLEGWYNWLSEPVRKLAQLNTALQRAWFGPDRNAVQATVTATMAVTEINGDVALFAIKVLPYNAPATAVVSLVEIGHGASLTSIVEEGDDGSGTSVVEN